MGFYEALRALREPEFTTLELRANPLETPSTSLSSPAAFNFAMGSGEPTASGEIITEQNVTNISTAYAAIRLLGESVGTLPLKVYEHLPNGRQESPLHSLSYLLNGIPNPDQTSADMIEALVFSMATNGNGYIEVTRDGQGIVTELYPLPALATTPVRNANGSITFETRDANGEKRNILPKNMIHAKLGSLDGLKGISPVHASRQTLGLSQALVKAGSRHFGNGSRPGGILNVGSDMTPEQISQFKIAWEQQQSGLNQGRVAVLPVTAKYEPMGFSPEDSQYLATRELQIRDIAAIWRIPSHLLGDNTRMATANHEQSALSLLQDTLTPYIVKIQNAFEQKLLPATKGVRSKFFIKFDLTDRLKTDRKTTLESIAVGRQWGVYSINDARHILGLNPIGPDGDVYNQPTNMINAEQFVDWTPTSKPTPTPTPEPEQKSSFVPVMRDTLGRLTTRQNRTPEMFAGLFTPLYTSMAGQIVIEARNAFKVSAEWNPDVEKILKDCLKSVEHRSSTWTPETDLDATATIETEKSYRTIKLSIYRDCGAYIAISQDQPHE
jgi:HK97 family phage portal protein